MKDSRTIRMLAVVGAVGLVGAFAGCRGDRDNEPPRQFFPDLDNQLKWKPQSESEFFADKRTMRVPVAGTVAFGTVGMVPREEWGVAFEREREDLLKGDPKVFEGLGEDGTYLVTIPVPVTAELIARGQEKFNIYCSVCHGYLGDGKGQVGQQWSYALPNFHDDKYKKPDPKVPDGQQYKDGYIFHTARYGVIDPTGAQKMPGYAHAIGVKDAWGVVAYFRALQASRTGTLNDVPEAAREKLKQSRGAAPAAPVNGGAK